MPIVRTKAGLEKIHIDNLHEIVTTPPDTSVGDSLLTSIDTKLTEIQTDTSKSVSEINFFTNLSISASGQRTSTTKDVSLGRSIAIVGSESVPTESLVQLYAGASNDTFGQYLIAEGYFKLTPIQNSSNLLFGVINDIPFTHCYIKVLNESGVSSNITIKAFVRQ